jgi:hypothetical protein
MRVDKSGKDEAIRQVDQFAHDRRTGIVLNLADASPLDNELTILDWRGTCHREQRAKTKSTSVHE